MNRTLTQFNLIHSAIGAAYHDAALKMGLSNSEMDILYITCCEGNGINQSIIYKQTETTKSTVNSALHKMQSKGLLELKSGEGRNVKVFLTTAGEELMNKTAKSLIEKESEIFDSWTQADCETFIALNQKYLDGIKKKVSEL